MINIDRCYSTGMVQGTSNVGGLIGFAHKVRITNSYSTSDIEETLGWRTSLYGREYMFMYFGGLIGTCGEGELINCYSAGKVAVEPYAPYSQVEYHGFIGPSIYGYDNDAESCYFDVDKAGRSDNCAEAKSTQQMKSQSTFAGWDFTNIWIIDGSVNEGYPQLLFSYSPVEGLNIFAVTDMGLKQVTEVYVITDIGLKKVSQNKIISDTSLK